VLWDFHDLLFHTHSTEDGRPTRSADFILMRVSYLRPPAVRSGWPGKTIDLRKVAATPEVPSPFARLLEERHSTRDFDDKPTITLGELARLLDKCRARPCEMDKQRRHGRWS